MTILAVALIAGLVAATPAPKPTHPPKPSVTMVQAVAYLLPLAKNDFVGIRGPKESSNNYDYTNFSVAKTAYVACGGCRLTDNYADSKFAEAWTAGSTWYYEGKPTPEQLAEDGAGRLHTLLKGFKLTHGTTTDGRVWVDWDGPNHVWVELRTNSSDYDDPGYVVRVGHSLTKAVHVVKVTTFTDAQKAALQTALASVIKLSTNDGTNNFTSLRGAVKRQYYKPNDFEPYECAAAFPPLDGCEITGLLNYSAAKWLFEFRTPGIGGSTDAAKEWVHSVVVAALPSSYSVATPSGPYPDDYEWTAPGSMEISYKSSYASGVTTFSFTVWHFLQ